MGDSNVSGFDDDSAMGMPTAGKNRFDVLLKSLIARIEFNGTLAPIQEYGRHQQKAAANNKKKKVKKPQQEQPNEKSEDPSEIGAGGAGAKYDDNFYDLDDDFIDDGDLEMNDQDEDMELFADGDTSKFQSGRESVVPKPSTGEDEGGAKSDKEIDGDVDNDASHDPDKERQ